MPDIEINKIQPNKLNPRVDFNQSSLRELTESVREIGILEPIIVRPINNDGFEIVIGERRFRAAKQAGLNKIPAVIKNYSDEQVMEINIIENVQRQDLTAVEKGNICSNLMRKFPDRYPSAASLAKHLGIGETSVNSWLLTTEMPMEVQRRIATKNEHGFVPAGKIDYQTAVTISQRIKEPEKFTRIIEHIADNKIPRRVATKVTQQVIREPEKPVDQIFKELVEDAPIFLPFSKIHAEQIVKNLKTQTSRKTKDPRLQIGSIVRAQVTHYADLKITNVIRKKLSEFTEDDAQREGGYTLEEFKKVWIKLHGKWEPGEHVYVMQFNFLREV
jgi:ParB/RepB/Spo0J family partition protein